MIRGGLIAVLAALLLGVLAGCGMLTNPGPSDMAQRSTSALESLTLAGYTGSGDPHAGQLPPPSEYEVFLTGHIESARRSTPGDNSSSSPNDVDLFLDVQGTNALLTWSTSHLGRWLVVLLDGRVVSAQLVDKQISDGRLSISVDSNSAVGRNLLNAVEDSSVR